MDENNTTPETLTVGNKAPTDSPINTSGFGQPESDVVDEVESSEETVV